MKFRIGWDDEDRAKLHGYWDNILDSHRWSGGFYVDSFEEQWSELIGRPAVALSSWSGAAQIVMHYYQLVRSGKVACPSNTFMATPLAVIKAGSSIQWVDINRTDLCMSVTDLVDRIRWEGKPRAVFLVHIGGHVAFDVESIADYCRAQDILLFEDCAHAHGAEWNGKRPGSWGDCGIYSFYATKTISTGEGAILVGPADLIEFAKRYRDYGKPGYGVFGQNLRLSEFQAAVGCVVTDRLPDIVAWKNEYAITHLEPTYGNTRVRMPEGMVSGYYKYIVFDGGEMRDSTGRVYADPAHTYLDPDADLPHTNWVAANHSCCPLFYRGADVV